MVGPREASSARHAAGSGDLFPSGRTTT